MGSRRVLHLTGSPVSAEFDELSRLYARGCLAAVDDPSRYTPVIAHVGPGGVWRFPRDLSDGAVDAAEPVEAPEAIQRICELDPDVMVPHLFCLAGMTDYRALFDVLGIPYVGNRPEAMAITARKDLARAVVAAAGVAVPEAQVISDGEVATLAPPVVIKPLAGDNSTGLALIRERVGAGEDRYRRAIAQAREWGDQVLIERFIEPGREVRCGLYERDGELLALPLEEYPVSAQHPIRSAADKLGRDDEGQLALMAKGGSRAWIVDAEDPINEAVQAAARRCHLALGCRHYSLFDFRIDPAGQPWFLEAGLYCSFSPQSVLATMARAAGLSTRAFFDVAIAEATRPAMSGALR